MRPSLPQHAVDARRRADRLRDARARYRLDTSYRGYKLAAEVPDADRFDASFIAEAAELMITAASNAAASRLSVWLALGVEGVAARARALLASVARGRADPGRDADAPTRGRHPLQLEDYERMYSLLPTPASMRGRRWREDWYFAWQRLAGCNPIMIERVTALPDHFPVEERHLGGARVRGLVGDDERLAAARAEGRLFLVDHGALASVPPGHTDGRPKRVPAPLSLYLYTRPAAGAGRLVPVAIQCGQTPGPETPIYTPADGGAWAMAKCAVQIADANFQGVVSHLGYCHLIMESVIVTAHRQLSADHPLLRLLIPHARFTLASNEVMRRSIISENGNMDRLQSGTLAGSTELVQGCLARYPLSRVDAPTSFRDRGVDGEGITDYPFRDDALDSWAPLLRFVRAYVELYYRAPADVAADHELRAWVRELGDSVHSPCERMETVEDVVMLIARALYTCSIFHAAINYSSYDFLGYPPNMSAAAWGPLPGPQAPADERALLRMMAPLDLSLETISLMYTIGARHNRLGEYPAGHFQDPAVQPLITRFRRELDAVEERVKARNNARPIAYEYLLPSRITASIHV